MSSTARAVARPAGGTGVRGSSLTGWSGRALVGVSLAVATLFFAAPLLWLLIAGSKTQRELSVENPFALGSFSTLGDNLHQLLSFQGGAVLTWLGNSALYSGLALVLTLVVSIPAGYAMALTEFPLRRTLVASTLVVMLMPSTALVLPVFLEMNAVGLVGSALSVVLPFSYYPFGVYLTYIYFSTSIPRDLLAAARLDGCSEWQVFARVALPLATPVTALVAFFSFVQNWNNYFLPFVMLPSSDGYPMQVGLSTLLAAAPAFNPSSAGTESIQLPVLALATVASMLPVLVLFLFSQRFLVAGMTAGGTKE